jgi:hypothetical protein
MTSWIADKAVDASKASQPEEKGIIDCIEN